MEKRRLNTIEDIEDFIYLLKSSNLWINLQDKTQVFNNRVNASVKSRGSHCEDVAAISETLASQMGADSFQARKAYLIGLLHDVGHIPFGHAGESVAANIIEKTAFSDEERRIILEARKKVYGEKYVENLEKQEKNPKNPTKNFTFEHNENSVLQYIIFCHQNGFEIDEEIIVGIISHSTSRVKEVPPTLPEQAVRLADKLAYINYDINDLYLTFTEEDYPEEHNALDELYTNKIKDPYGNEIRINVNGKEYSIIEFVKLDPQIRIDLLVSASIEDAKKHNKENYGTYLTGCNDLVVELSDLQKKRKKAKKDNSKEEVEKYTALIADKKKELYERSPIMYAAYEIKEQSDNFIRSGIGLSRKTQLDRTVNARSAVGNYDLINEFIYKSLVENLMLEIEANRGLSEEELKQKYYRNPDFLNFYNKYLEYRDIEVAAIKSVSNNPNAAVFPELYSVVNYIGTHSNTQMYAFAIKYGLYDKYVRDVLPKLQELQTDPLYYDFRNATLTKEGNERRSEIVSQYGATIKLDFSLEEEGLTPTASFETIELMEECGFLINYEDTFINEIIQEIGSESISSKFRSTLIEGNDRERKLNSFLESLDEIERQQVSEMIDKIKREKEEERRINL